MKPTEFLNELSNDTLASYKKNAGADATTSDRAGDTKKADKRFNGIVKATKKQFANDSKSIKENNNFDKLGFSVRSDILWPAKLFETKNTQAIEDLRNWLDTQRNKTKKPKEKSNCILAMIQHTFDEIVVMYGDAKYIGETETHYILQVPSGTHEYSKNTQIVFNSQTAFDHFITILHLRFEDADVKITVKKDIVTETTNNYHANRTGFSRGSRDDERHDLDVQQPSKQEWALKINGKVWSKDGKTVTFASKEAALNIRNSILKNRPDLEIGLVTRGGVAEAGTGLDINRSIPGRTIARISSDSPNPAIGKLRRNPLAKKLPDFYNDNDDYDQWSGKTSASIGDDEEDTFDKNYMGDDDEDELKEISNQTLGQYKTKAAADAGKSDLAGDYKKADKRFSGIVKATKKQFANDTKTVKEDINSVYTKAKLVLSQLDESMQQQVLNTLKKSLDDEEHREQFKPLPENLGNELKSKSIQALEQVKKQLEQQRMADLEQWEKDFKQNTVAKFVAREPNLTQRATSTPTVSMPSEKYSILKNRLVQLDKAIEKQGILDNLVQKLDKKGLLTPNIQAGVDTSILVRDGARDNYVELNKKLDKALEYVKNRLLTNKAAYAKPKTIDEDELDENCWKGYHKEGNKKMFGKTVPNCVKNEDIDEDNHRVPRKAGQPANSKKHSDLYTDENPKGTITGLKFATEEDARASVSKIRNSGRSHAHKVQAAVAMEQRARAAGKASAAKVYRDYINSVKKTNEEQLDEMSSEELDKMSPEELVRFANDARNNKLKNIDPNSIDKAYGKSMSIMFPDSDKRNTHSTNHKQQNMAEEKCPHCNGPMFSEMIMNEKKDACYYKVKSRYKVWPSAYASGALVKCRKKGASNWGTGGKKNESSILEGIEIADESLHDWFNKEKWVRMDTKGNIKGPCAKEPGEGKPKCLPQSKAHSLGKKGRASAAQRKRREDPNPERSGKAINVNTKKKSNEDVLDEKWSQKYKNSINCSNPKGFSQKAHCAGKQKNESSIMQGLNHLDEGWKEKLGAAALAGSMALGAGAANARVTPDEHGNFIGGMKPTATVVAPDNIKPTASVDTTDPFKGLVRADSADRQAKTITVAGKEYRLVEISPTDMRPRGGQQIVVPQAILGERSIGNYMGILAGNTVYVISK